MAHDHGHAGDHAHSPGRGHGHAAPPGDWRYGAGILLNLAFVGVEATAGIFANSTALLADAGHNLSDVLGLALAGGAAWLARRHGSERRTYGYGKATILAALANALVLVFACGAIVWEASKRFSEPASVSSGLIIGVAALGVLINTGTALLFMAGRKHDVNVRGAFLHMAADAGVSAGVIVAGVLIAWTGRTWIDPATSLLVVGVVLIGTWGLLRESLDLAMDVAPFGIDVPAVRAALANQPGVAAVHDLHVWAMNTTEPALTAHLVRPAGADDRFLQATCALLKEQFGIEHATLQVESRAAEHCPTH